MKGTYSHECNRTACNNEPAEFYNQSTHKYYCAKCADKINRLNRFEAMQLYKSELCLHTDKAEFKIRWSELGDKDRFFAAYAHTTIIKDRKAFIREGGIEHLKRCFDLGNPMLFITEDRMRYRIAAESADVMKVIIANYIKENYG